MRRVFAALLFAASLAFGQVNVTSVSGTVTDPTGAAVPGATVQVVNTSTSAAISVTTNDKGEYAVPTIPAGTYRITVSKAGFKTITAEDTALIVGVPGVVN